jgi:hypothetical protein
MTEISPSSRSSRLHRLLPVLGVVAGLSLVIVFAMRSEGGRAIMRHLDTVRGPAELRLTGRWRRVDGSADADFTLTDKNGTLTGTARVPGGVARLHGVRDGVRAWIAFDDAPAGGPKFNFVLVGIDSALFQIRRTGEKGHIEQHEEIFVREERQSARFVPHGTGR